MATSPTIPTGKDIYNLIMGHIEPDLTTDGRKILREKYKDETQEQRRERKERYEQALIRYEEAFNGYISTLQEQVGRYQRDSLADIEMRDREREVPALVRFDQAFQQAA